MNRNLYLLFALFICGCLHATAQNDSINWLDEVRLSDVKLQQFSTGKHINELSDSLLIKNQPQLTEILSFNSSIYFKENGRGMVSSPSFRGTTASQIAVVWNGININSQFNGQLDFNTVNTGAYDQISVRGGGGSVVYGTGAIGGSVHLNNSLSFKKKQEHQLLLQYGSFNTIDARYNFKLAKNKWSLNLALSRNSSDNDYDYPNERGKNLNGEYSNNSVNVAFGYRFNSANTLKIISELYDGERHFSLIRPTENKTKYRDLNNRNLLEWNSEFSNFKQITSLAFLREDYQYFANIDSDTYSYGTAKSYIAKYDLGYNLNSDVLLNTVVQNTYTDGEGSNIANNDRNILSVAILGKHSITQSLQYEAGLRKEITGNYESPILFSFGANYKMNDFYTLKLNASKNFRIPTYNDLYWSSAGNPDLDPETSLQAELGNHFRFENMEAGISMYYNDVSDMIRWLPGGDGIWRPRNEDKVNIYGLESFVNCKKSFSKETNLIARASYAYTISKNSETNKQLIYVPYHKVTGNLSYQIHQFTPFLQVLYNGSVYTRTDYSEQLSGYFLANLGMSYTIDKERDWELGGRVNNLFNTEYQNVEDRWMPGINFNLYINFKF
ncbi:TonB-dependent receptor plug domain-containing protein [Christiangramia forsetii]|uniref:TonB-dependent outer membrane receptor n=2 Tax=Christiangramia forsetii TaxID=411153 RepID=A0M0B4_CHRFK|nr:TonB-dependent receptor [Christiangramia forsetii]GGG41362.1 TonB-dependent receptor [Christiangramia forsetii]CAL66059.1 TonB-dependent outer membrane receptor [Christiangramia forsetii KT0803]